MQLLPSSTSQASLFAMLLAGIRHDNDFGAYNYIALCTTFIGQRSGKMACAMPSESL
jgi:hypothetical protein